MKNNAWLFMGFMIMPFFLLPGQDKLPTTTDADSNHQSLLAFANDSSKSDASQIIALDKEPKVIKRVEPKYPGSMLRDGWQADVFLKAFIDINGNVTDAQLIEKQILPYKSSEAQKKDSKITDGKEFVDSAIAAARKWKFAPAQKQGKIVATWVTIPFRFRISTSEEDDSKDNALRNEYSKIFMSTHKIIENVIKGKNIGEVKQQHLDSKANIIYGNQYLSLYDVLNGENKDIKLNEGNESKLRFLNFAMSDDKTSVLVAIKSQAIKGGPERFHTIIFTKSREGEWQINHWHVSW